MQRFDELDMQLLNELTADSSISIPILAKRLGVNQSVAYNRIKRMTKKGLIKKFTIVIDDSVLGIGVRALVGVNRDPKFKRQIHEELQVMSEVVSFSEITGRFDMVITVSTSSLEMLHMAVIEKIGKIKGIQSTETFVELQKIDKDPSYLGRGSS